MVFFFNDTATTEIYTLSLHDALPIWLTTGPHLHYELYDPVTGKPIDPLGGRGGGPGGWVGKSGDLKAGRAQQDRKSTRLNSSHANISYSVFCLKKNKT